MLSILLTKSSKWNSSKEYILFTSKPLKSTARLSTWIIRPGISRYIELSVKIVNVLPSSEIS